MENDIIYERVYVETPVDTDCDGLKDLIAVYIRRPSWSSDENRVPAIFVANPYLMFCNEDWYITHDVDKELKVFPEQGISYEDIRVPADYEPAAQVVKERETLGHAVSAVIDKEPEFECISGIYDYLNNKGYAAVFSGGLGTRGSQGLTLTGSREEILAFRSVIDWLCGRCRAFTNLTDNIEVSAPWCTGKVAMSAKSYLGTMCIGVAATGVEGLETVIPEAGISNWYEYFRYNGLVLPAIGWQGDDLDLLAAYCLSRAKDPEDYEGIRELFGRKREELTAGEDRESGNYNRFWDERNYLRQADNIRASFFIIHGLNDWNVKMNQCIPLFKALEERGIERKLLLHQGQHVYVYNLKGAGVTGMLERWLDHYLKGVDNGVEKEPRVLVESNLDQSVWMESGTWPPEGARDISPAPYDMGCTDEEEMEFTDELAATVYDRASDNLDEWRDELVLSESHGYRNRLRLVWDPFEVCAGAGGAAGQGCDGTPDALRLCGTFRISFEACIDRPAAILSAMLVDLGDDRRITAGQAEEDDGSFAFELEKEPSHYRVITRGWMNAQNRSCNYSKETIVPGEYYSYSFDMVPMDYSIRLGHRLALIIYGIDAEATLRPDTVTRVKLRTGSIRLKLTGYYK